MKTAKLLKKDRSQAALSQFLSPLEIAPHDDKAAVAYGQIRSHLKKKGCYRCDGSVNRPPCPEHSRDSGSR